jgi:hypothetical protein
MSSATGKPCIGGFLCGTSVLAFFLLRRFA